jgi:hypothetical protein
MKMSEESATLVTRLRRTLLMLVVTLLSASVVGQPLPEPNDAHPRLFAEQGVAEALAEIGRQRGSFVYRTIERCRQIAAEPQRFATDGYMGLDWAQYLQACLVAHRATGEKRFGDMALVYFKALIDDLKNVGDGAGGDAAARRDSGFAMRALGPNAALAYDWLHDYDGVDEALRARARQRFKAWTDWYLDHGYRARSPGTNYQAGYLFAATLIATAQGSEAGPDGAALWNHVVENLFRRDMLPAMDGDGILVGGDWGEGWQYGPLSIAEYSLAARALQRYGLDATPFAAWLESVVMRHVYAMLPGSRAQTFVLGDTQSEQPHLDVRAETLAAVVAGPATAEVRGWAEAEMRRLGLYDEGDGFPLFRSLAEATRTIPVDVARAELPPLYLAQGTGALYVRFSWSDSSVWFTALCSPVRDVDHMHPNAGNFVLSRGDDDVIVDPSPYGTLSTLTSNAPTVRSNGLPEEYKPSQAYWGGGTEFAFIRHLRPSGILAARCDYAQQYRIQDRPSDVPFAQRDFVAVPANEGRDAALVVLDRATTPGPSNELNIRFRTLASMTASAEGYSGEVGATRMVIHSLAVTPGSRDLRSLPGSTCFVAGYTRGGCDAARFPVHEYRVQLAGPKAAAVHVITAASDDGPEVSHTQIDNLGLVSIAFPEREVFVVEGDVSRQPLLAPPRAATLILLDVVADSRATGIVDGAMCRVSVASATPGTISSPPFAGEMTRDCVVTAAD